MGNLRAWVETLRKDGKVRGYRVRYRDENKEIKSKPGVFERKEDANIYKDKTDRELRDGQLGRTSSDILTRDAFDRWIEECEGGVANIEGTVIKANSLKTYRSHLQGLIERAPKLVQIDEECIKEWKEELKEKNEPWTISGKLRDAKNFLRWCKRQKLINDEPFLNIGISTPEPKPRYFTDEELIALEKAAVGDIMQIALRLGYKCGLRRSEILRIDKRDIRWLPNGTGELFIWSNVSKNKANRTVPLPVSVMELIGSRGSGKLYNMKEESFAYYWHKLKAKAGIVEPENWYKRFKWKGETDDKADQARFHDLRHTFCRIFLEKKAGDISDLAKITGHKSLNVLFRIYSHFQTTALHESMAIMESRSRFYGANVEQLREI